MPEQGTGAAGSLPGGLWRGQPGRRRSGFVFGAGAPDARLGAYPSGVCRRWRCDSNWPGPGAGGVRRGAAPTRTQHCRLSPAAASATATFLGGGAGGRGRRRLVGRARIRRGGGGHPAQRSPREPMLKLGIVVTLKFYRSRRTQGTAGRQADCPILQRAGGEQTRFLLRVCWTQPLLTAPAPAHSSCLFPS
ncbi:uncharacterized protein LOC142365439 isoform X2 [Opisthocomus hoazin]|uniref:uncharacterized protein LOC142365439 isoform X2 n=1 Tax=Opisthocomus hoazin TaxID=30419 RepID=UPI003F5377E7